MPGTGTNYSSRTLAYRMVANPAVTIEVPNMKKRRPHKEGQKFGGSKEDARQILNLTDGSEKPVGEWNSMTIEALGNEIIVHLNGDLVNHGANATVSKGKIALQAEGSEVEFRKVELTTLAND